MDYAKIKSTPGGKAPQWYPGEQPLTASRKGTNNACPARVQGGPKPRQMNTNGKHK